MTYIGIVKQDWKEKIVLERREGGRVVFKERRGEGWYIKREGGRVVYKEGMGKDGI